VSQRSVDTFCKRYFHSLGSAYGSVSFGVVRRQVLILGVSVFARYALQDRLQPVEAELAVVSAFHQRTASLESHVIALKSVHGIVGAAGK